jgi:hypothetical protein
MTRRQEKALDIAEYTLGVPLFIGVSAVTAAVMAVGFGAIETVSWVRERI